MRLQKARGFRRRELFLASPEDLDNLTTLWIDENHLPIDDKVTVSRCIKNVRNGQLGSVSRLGERAFLSVQVSLLLATTPRMMFW